jgi:diguanylate cyclase (GGDEF)-like protein/PAS domain S-box-containing protein
MAGGQPMKNIFSESSMEIYQSIIEHNSDAIFVLTVDFRISKINQVVTKVFGYSQDELEGIPLIDLIVPEHIEKFNLHFNQVIQGTACEDEIDTIHKCGEILHIHVKSIPLFVKNKMVGIFCVAKDLTELIKAKISLRKSEERFQKVVEYSPNGILVHRNEIIEYANPASIKIMNDDHLIGKSIISCIHSSDYETYKQRHSDFKIGKDLPFTEMKWVRPDGEIIQVEAGGVSFIDDGSVLITSIFRDVTDRYKIEQALKESEERYRLIADNVKDLVAIFDANGVTKYASPSHQLVLGFAQDDYEGKHAFDYVHPEDLPNRKSLFRDLVLTKENKVLEFRHKHVNGDWIWIEEKVVPIFDESGNLLHFLAFGREITDRKMYEAQLNQMAYHDTLTGLPNRRLLKERLDQSLKEAKRYDRKLAVLYLDLDNFKQINDSFGHDVGDELLKQFSDGVGNLLRDCDTFARVGGDEFTILLPEIQTVEDVFQITNSIITFLQNPWRIGDQTFQATSSIGVAFYPNDASTTEMLMKLADKALYEAKEDGKNNIKSYSMR